MLIEEIICGRQGSIFNNDIHARIFLVDDNFILKRTLLLHDAIVDDGEKDFDNVAQS